MHLQEDCADFCNAYHVVHKGVNAGTQVTLASDAVQTLDESMGVMSIIAPYIQTAQRALADAVIQAENLQGQLDRLEELRPTLFVEGATEYLIYKSLLERLRPEAWSHIHLSEPPKRAGANYVANMLRSWEYRVKHLPRDQRVRASGIVDRDEEGSRACNQFEQEAKSFKYVELFIVDVPEHLKELVAKGVTIPVCLEECWPQEYWDFADESGWLVERPKKPIFEEWALQTLIDRDFKVSEYLDEEHLAYFHKWPDPALEAHVKIEWAQYMISLSDEDLEMAAASILANLDKVIYKLIPH